MVYLPKNRITVPGKLRKGRGLGEVENYEPWTQVGDFPGGKGWNSYINCLITNRPADSLSKGENYLRFINEFRPEVVDLQENFALPWNDVLAMTNELGIKRPKIWKEDNEPLTIDLMVTCKSSEGGKWREAYDYKMESSLHSQRIMAELQVKQALCKYDHCSYKLKTDKTLDFVYAKNLAFLRHYYDPNEFQHLDIEKMAMMEPILYREISSSPLPLSYACAAIDNQYAFHDASCLTLVYLLIWHRFWSIDLHQPLVPAEKRIEILERIPFGKNNAH